MPGHPAAEDRQLVFAFLSEAQPTPRASYWTRRLARTVRQAFELGVRYQNFSCWSGLQPRLTQNKLRGSRGGIRAEQSANNLCAEKPRSSMLGSLGISCEQDFIASFANLFPS